MKTKQEWLLAVLDEHNDVLDVVKSPEDAIGLAEDYAGVGHVQTDHLQEGPVRQNPYYDLAGDLADVVQSFKAAEQTPIRNIFKATGLPVVSGQEVLDLTEGLTSADAVYEILYPYFSDLASYGRTESKTYSTPAGLVKALIGGNEKVNKPRAGLNGTIKGLTLVPFWRNMQDELVRDAPQNKALLRKIEADFDTKKAPRDALNWCAGSSEACRRACLIGTGNNYQPYSFKVKFARAEALKDEPVAFLAGVSLAIRGFYEGQARRNKQAFVRLNMLSDIPWELVFPDLFELFPDVQFYDYTKLPVHKRQIPANYDLTFSFSGTNDNLCEQALRAQHRVAVVFVSGDPKRSPYRKDARVSYGEIAEELGATTTAFGVSGLPVIDGDVTDFRAVDPAPSIVALSYKGPKGVNRENELRIRYQSRFATVIPVRDLGGGILATSHTPLQTPFDPDDTDIGNRIVV